jgi:5-methylcytosine-specific restriction protein A
MPYKPKVPCGYPGCMEKVESGTSPRLCPKHLALQRKKYDKKRGSAGKRGYDAKWRKYRQWYLIQNPLCRICEQEGRATIATVVDHVVSIKSGGSFWDPNNHQPLCKMHHDQKTAKEDGGFGR